MSQKAKSQGKSTHSAQQSQAAPSQSNLHGLAKAKKLNDDMNHTAQDMQHQNQELINRKPQPPVTSSKLPPNATPEEIIRAKDYDIHQLQSALNEKDMALVKAREAAASISGDVQKKLTDQINALSENNHSLNRQLEEQKAIIQRHETQIVMLQKQLASTQDKSELVQAQKTASDHQNQLRIAQDQIQTMQQQAASTGGRKGRNPSPQQQVIAAPFDQTPQQKPAEPSADAWMLEPAPAAKPADIPEPQKPSMGWGVVTVDKLASTPMPPQKKFVTQVEKPAEEPKKEKKGKKTRQPASRLDQPREEVVAELAQQETVKVPEDPDAPKGAWSSLTAQAIAEVPVPTKPHIKPVDHEGRSSRKARRQGQETSPAESHEEEPAPPSLSKPSPVWSAVTPDVVAAPPKPKPKPVVPPPQPAPQAPVEEEKPKKDNRRQKKAAKPKPEPERPVYTPPARPAWGGLTVEQVESTPMPKQNKFIVQHAVEEAPKPEPVEKTPKDKKKKHTPPPPKEEAKPLPTYKPQVPGWSALKVDDVDKTINVPLTIKPKHDQAEAPTSTPEPAAERKQKKEKPASKGKKEPTEDAQPASLKKPAATAWGSFAASVNTPN